MRDRPRACWRVNLQVVVAASSLARYRPYSRRYVRRGQQTAPGWGEVLLILGLSLLAVPLCMAIEIYG
jgi:hypothetical protein